MAVNVYPAQNYYPIGLLADREPPCLSLYQPTHRHSPENQQDPILYRNLLRELESSLLRKYPKREAKQLLEPFKRLEGDREFWNNALDGLAVLGAPGFFHYYRLQRPVEQLVVVADSFHTKPLLRIFQSSSRFQVLGLSRKEVKLYEGDRYAIDRVELDQEVPRTVTDALGGEHTEPHLTVASYGTGAEGPAMHHGHGGRKDDVDIDEERFFRVIDRAILEHHSKPSGLPLMLAALPEHHGLFHKISNNPFLVEEGIDVHPDDLDAGKFLERAWQAFEPRYKAFLEGLVEDFANARAKDLGEEDLEKIAFAAVAGGIDTLLIEADRQVPGKLDADTGGIELADLESPDVDDLLDDLGELVLKRGGRTIVVPAERMPTQTGAAAVCRFKCT